MSDARSTTRPVIARAVLRRLVREAAGLVQTLVAVSSPLVERALAAAAAGARRLDPVLRREWVELRRAAADPGAVWERVVDGWSPRREATAAVAWTAVVPHRSALATHRHRRLPPAPPPPTEPPRRPALYLGFAVTVALLVAAAVGAAALG